MMGISQSRFGTGTTTSADQVLVALVLGMHAHRRSPRIVSGRVVATAMPLAVASNRREAVLEVVERAVLLGVVDLEVAQTAVPREKLSS